jgi:hypothetical protein
VQSRGRSDVPALSQSGSKRSPHWKCDAGHQISGFERNFYPPFHVVKTFIHAGHEHTFSPLHCSTLAAKLTRYRRFGPSLSFHVQVDGNIPTQADGCGLERTAVLVTILTVESSITGTTGS